MCHILRHRCIRSTAWVFFVLLQSHDERVTAHWASQQQQWQALTEHLVQQTGKDPKDLTLARSEWMMLMQLSDKGTT